MADALRRDWIITRLRSALENYGHHHPWCAVAKAGARAPVTCDCGLDDYTKDIDAPSLGGRRVILAGLIANMLDYKLGDGEEESEDYIAAYAHADNILSLLAEPDALSPPIMPLPPDPPEIDDSVGLGGVP